MNIFWAGSRHRIKIVFLSLLFLYDNGRIVPGNQIEGWADIKMPSMEQCLELSRFMYTNPMPLPRHVTAIISFCITEEQKQL